MNSREKRQILLKTFGVCSEDQIKNTSRYKVLVDSVQQRMLGLCCFEGCSFPMSTISFDGDFESKEVLDPKRWNGYCRIHKKDILGFNDSVISSVGRRTPVLDDASNPQTVCSSLEREFFHPHKKGNHESEKMHQMP